MDLSTRDVQWGFPRSPARWGFFCFLVSLCPQGCMVYFSIHYGKSNLHPIGFRQPNWNDFFIQTWHRLEVWQECISRKDMDNCQLSVKPSSQKCMGGGGGQLNDDECLFSFHELLLINLQKCCLLLLSNAGSLLLQVLHIDQTQVIFKMGSTEQNVFSNQKLWFKLLLWKITTMYGHNGE